MIVAACNLLEPPVVTESHKNRIYSHFPVFMHFMQYFAIYRKSGNVALSIGIKYFSMWLWLVGVTLEMGLLSLANTPTVEIIAI